MNESVNKIISSSPSFTNDTHLTPTKLPNFTETKRRNSIVDNGDKFLRSQTRRGSLNSQLSTEQLKLLQEFSSPVLKMASNSSLSQLVPKPLTSVPVASISTTEATTLLPRNRRMSKSFSNLSAFHQQIREKVSWNYYYYFLFSIFKKKF
jgi:hypothetical protein